MIKKRFDPDVLKFHDVENDSVRASEAKMLLGSYNIVHKISMILIFI